jgi:hypothetical protein
MERNTNMKYSKMKYPATDLLALMDRAKEEHVDVPPKTSTRT